MQLGSWGQLLIKSQWHSSKASLPTHTSSTACSNYEPEACFPKVVRHTSTTRKSQQRSSTSLDDRQNPIHLLIAPEHLQEGPIQMLFGECPSRHIFPCSLTLFTGSSATRHDSVSATTTDSAFSGPPSRSTTSCCMPPASLIIGLLGGCPASDLSASDAWNFCSSLPLFSHSMALYTWGASEAMSAAVIDGHPQ